MKGLYRHICLTLTLSLLLSSVGVALPRHICLMTGLVMEAPEAKTESCCKKKQKAHCNEAVQLKKASQEDESCCALSVEHEKLSPEASLKNASLNFLALSPA